MSKDLGLRQDYIPSAIHFLRNYHLLGTSPHIERSGPSFQEAGDSKLNLDLVFDRGKDERFSLGAWRKGRYRRLGEGLESHTLQADLQIEPKGPADFGGGSHVVNLEE
jgi:hypothetical protein